ncbi:MAG: hypothetical protein AVDCRST_MAG43-1674 [uncultured Thermomicrobiales bacterium]|uniref:2-phospho-L-lactate guanylyltransferase n=1 Tax=uncultured Thermomicrobiales bacterium TaxID=1645740 RepID=A0A6J4UW97_9BACT|nr:MAG: hypothetical protein AVDCRST_MAG43-1674 [uncultured Thermomicrobiales bacterium]
MSAIAALVPVRNRVDGKRRLSAEFEPSERRALIESMAQHVVTTLMRSGVVSRVMVISKDVDFIDDILPDIAGVALIHQPSSVVGLNAALGLGREWAMVRGVSRLLVLSGDLPLLTVDDVRELGRRSSPVVLASDWAGRGTNGLLLNEERLPRAASGSAASVNLISDFAFKFGTDSLPKHVEEAARLGAPAEIVLGRGTAHDLDTPEDWKLLDPAAREWLLPHDPCMERSSTLVRRSCVSVAMMEHS